MTVSLPSRPILRRGFLLALAAVAMLAVSLMPDTSSAQTSSTLVSNTGQTGEGHTEPLHTQDIAQLFKTGTNPHGYVITEIQLQFGAVRDRSVIPRVSIWEAGTNIPSNQRVGTLTQTGPFSGNRLISWTSPGIFLSPNTDYYVVVDGGGNTAENELRTTTSDAEDSGGDGTWSIGDEQRFRPRTTTAWGTGQSSLRLRIEGYARISTPLISNEIQPHHTWRTLNGNDFAQEFSTGPNAQGYTLTGVKLSVGNVANVLAVPEVSIWTERSDDPHMKVGTLSGGALGANTLNTWSTDGIYLRPNTDYIVFIDSSSTAQNALGFTASQAEDEGGTAGWSIRGNSRIRSGDAGWGGFGSALQLRIDGFTRLTNAPLPPTTPRVNSDPNAPTSLSASWGAPDHGAGNPPISGYDLRYSTDGSTWTDGPQAVTGTSATITDLTEGTAYQVQVRATTAATDGDGEWSSSGYGTAGGHVSRLVVGNTAQANEFTDNANLSTHDIFQPFTTGSQSAGYVVTSVDLLFLSLGVGGATTVPKVLIYEERTPSGSGLPGDEVGEFTAPARLVAGNDGVNTWTSPGIELDPDTTYLLVVVSTGDAPHIVRNISTKDDDAGGLAGWSVVDNHNIRQRNTSNYDTVQKNLKMRFYGHVFGGVETPTSGTLISNTGQSSGRDDLLFLSLWDVAQKFRTGPNPAGYTLTSVGLPFARVDGSSVIYRVSIYTSGGVNPGREVGVLNPPDSLSTQGLNIWTTPGIYLSENTDYFVLVDSSSGVLNSLAMTASDDEDAGGAAGWSIDDAGRAQARDGSVGWGPGFGAASFQIKIDGFARASNFPLPPTTPRVSADPGAPTTLSVSWGAPDDIVGGPPFTGYDLRYSTDGATWTDGPQGVTDTSATIIGLTRGTDYQVQVRASNSHADSRWSASGYGTAGDPASRLMVGTTGQSNDFVSNGDLSTDDIFQTFTTGSNVDGYVVTSVDLLFLSVAAARESIVPQVAIYEDRGGGAVGDEVGIFTGPVRLVEGNDGVNTWTSPGIQLEPKTTYVLAVDSDGTAAHVVRNTPSQANDGGGLEGWSLPTGHLHRLHGRTGYDNQLNTLKVRLFGHPDPGLPFQLFALHEDNANPWGIYSDGATIWVGDIDDSKLYAYTTSGTRVPASDIALALASAVPVGMWGDGTTLWVVDSGDDKAYAYDLSTVMHDSDKDIPFRTGSFPRGIWSDGETVWVSFDSEVLAYNLSTKGKVSSKDISLYEEPVQPGEPRGGHINATGIWSDATTLWGANANSKQIYAYNLTPGADYGARDGDKEFTLDSLDNPAGLWWSGSRDAQGGASLLIVDQGLDKVFAYPITVENRPPRFDLPRYERTLPDNATPGTAAGDPVAAESPDNDPLTYHLGGQDASSLNIDPSTGQISAKSGVTYDHRVKRYYRVTVTASDGSDSHSVQVTIEILPAGVSLSVTPSIVDEDAGEQAVSITATLLGPDRANNVTLSFTVGGTARSAVHYTTQPADIPDITITAGQRSGSASFRLRPIDDDERNGPRTIRLNTSIQDPITRVQLPASVVLTIEDDELGPCDPLPIAPGEHEGTLTRECYDNYSGGERLYAAYRQYRINLAERTRVMLVMESDLTEHRTIDGQRHTQFDPYLILLRVHPVPGLLPDVIGEYDDIDDSVGNDSAGFIRTLDPGEYIAYATSYAQGVTDVGFTLTYRHEDPNSPEALVLPGRQSELEYRNYDYLLEGWHTPLPDPDTTPQDLGISRNPGKISWYVDRALLGEDDYYRVWWAVSQEKLNGIDDPDRTQRWYTDLRGLDCDQDGRCEYQIPSFDTSKHYVVEVRLVDPVHHTLIAREWYIPPVEPEEGSASGLTAAALAGLTVQPVAGETTRLAVSWDAVTGADKYLVRWRTGTSNYTPGLETTGDSYTIATLLPDTAYTVSVSAIDTDADPHTELAWGHAAAWTPAPMGTVTVSPVPDHDDRLDVSWPAVNGATAYRVEYRTDGGSYVAVNRANPAATGERITELPAGTTYTVRVTAIHDGTDGDSAEGSAATTPAFWPVTVTATEGRTDALDVSWPAVEDARYYFVEVVGQGSHPAEVTPPRTGHRLTGLEADTEYTVLVWAVSSFQAGFETLAETRVRASTSATPDEPDEATAVSFVIYHDPGAGDAAANRYNRARTLLSDAGLAYSEVTDATQAQVDRLAGVTGSVMPRFFLGDPTGAGWTSEPGVNNGGLRWLEARVAELDDDADDTGADPPANTPATGAPTITGAAKVGETLTADTSGIGDADGLTSASFSYQWLADGTALSGATGSTYTPVAGDVGKAISVRVSFTDDGGNAESLTSAATTAVAAADPPSNSPATGAPTITGTAKVGETLTADTSGISDADGLTGPGFAYQWLADGADISGATGSTYTPVAGDVGRAITVRVSFTDDAGNAEVLTSAATTAVVAADPPDDEPDEATAVTFVIYHDPDAGDASVERYNEAKKLLSDAGLTYTEVTDATQADVDRLAGVTNSVMPRFFLGDPTEDGWTSEPGTNNGGLRWLKAKVAELSEE